MTTANSRQVGGTHYRSSYQHWDLMLDVYGPAWLAGCITKYATRWRMKNGVEDVRKAQHYLQKWLEVAGSYAFPMPATRTRVNHYVRENNLSADECTLLLCVCCATTTADLLEARDALDVLLYNAEQHAAATPQPNGYANQDGAAP